MMFCNIYALVDGEWKRLNVYYILIFPRFSFRWGNSVMNMREALEAVRWAHRRGWLTKKEDYG